MNLCAIKTLEHSRVRYEHKLPTTRDDESRAHVLWVGAEPPENAQDRRPSPGAAGVHNLQTSARRGPPGPLWSCFTRPIPTIGAPPLARPCRLILTAPCLVCRR